MFFSKLSSRVRKYLASGIAASTSASRMGKLPSCTEQSKHILMQRRLKPQQQFTTARHMPAYWYRMGHRFMLTKAKFTTWTNPRWIELQNIPCMMSYFELKFGRAHWYENSIAGSRRCWLHSYLVRIHVNSRNEGKKGHNLQKHVKMKRMVDFNAKREDKLLLKVLSFFFRITSFQHYLFLINKICFPSLPKTFVVDHQHTMRYTDAWDDILFHFHDCWCILCLASKTPYTVYSPFHLKIIHNFCLCNIWYLKNTTVFDMICAVWYVL